jgi:hypothetical protein
MDGAAAIQVTFRMGMTGRVIGTFHLAVGEDLRLMHERAERALIGIGAEQPAAASSRNGQQVRLVHMGKLLAQKGCIWNALFGDSRLGLANGTVAVEVDVVHRNGLELDVSPLADHMSAFRNVAFVSHAVMEKLVAESAHAIRVHVLISGHILTVEEHHNVADGYVALSKQLREFTDCPIDRKVFVTHIHTDDMPVLAQCSLDIDAIGGLFCAPGLLRERVRVHEDELRVSTEAFVGHVLEDGRPFLLQFNDGPIFQLTVKIDPVAAPGTSQPGLWSGGHFEFHEGPLDSVRLVHNDGI